MSYRQIGMLLLLLSACCMLAALWILREIIKDRKKPLYCRKIPRTRYSGQWIEEIQMVYKTSGNIRIMLNQLLEQCNSGLEKKHPGIDKKELQIRRKHVMAALSYLDHSRYRDYETVLQYLSDGSEKCDCVMQKILHNEIRKQKGLICKKDV